jgi:sigma-E factor negative regulatory protein RseA
MDKISALVDDELDEQQARQQIARLYQHEDLAACWHTYHLIGDVLRGEHPLRADFQERLKARLREEPTVIAPRYRLSRRITTYALSAAASVSAVAMVGWFAFHNPLSPQPEVAKSAPAAVPAATQPAQLASVPSEGRMSEYLIAHQEFSPSTAIQGVAPHIRSVSGVHRSQGR